MICADTFRVAPVDPGRCYKKNALTHKKRQLHTSFITTTTGRLHGRKNTIPAQRNASHETIVIALAIAIAVAEAARPERPPFHHHEKTKKKHGVKSRPVYFQLYSQTVSIFWHATRRWTRTLRTHNEPINEANRKITIARPHTLLIHTVTMKRSAALVLARDTH